MVRAVKIPLENAEEVRSHLQRRGLINHDYDVQATNKHLFIPVKNKVPEYEAIEIDLPEKEEHITDLKTLLATTLNEEELEQLKTAYDLVGDIAIIEVDKELRKHEQLIAQTLLDTQKSIRVVVRKQGAHTGELRLQDYQHLAGEERYDTITVESGVRLHIDIRKTYYSPRSATERLRIANLVQQGERVLVMFSGIAPFPLVISKHSEAEEIIGVELNDEAAKLASENIVRNKVNNVKALHGDVRDVVPRLGTFDRIIMPLPHTAHDFLDVAVPATKNGGMIHLYHFSTEEEVQTFALTIPAQMKRLGRKGTVEHIQKCGNLGPGIHRWSIDILIHAS